LVFFHSGFAFGPEDMLQCLEVTGDRFVVMTPMLRGENGGAGSFELWGGEVKDARAAIRWLAEREDVDPDQIYAFGHSVGGGVSALLSLVDNVPVRHTGSCGGLYPPSIFDEWADQLPFNDCPAERMTRLLIGNESHMLRDHFAYLGRQDPLEATSSLATEAPTNGSRLRIERVDGDHFTSFAPALRAYLGEIQKPK
jgi:acetyl esterase/lipase